MAIGAAAFAAATVGAGAICSTAAAAPQWQRATALEGSAIDEVSLARTPDGTLHVIWQIGTDAPTSSLHDTTISPTGALGPSYLISDGWSTLENPAALVLPDGSVEALAGGIIDSSDLDGLIGWNSSDGGDSWTQTAQTIGSSGPGEDVQSSAVAATLVSGTPFVTWSGTSGVWVHAGISSATPPNYDFQAAFGCCGYYPNIVTAADGTATEAWYSNADGDDGLWTQTVGTDGSPSGTPVRMPGTANMQVGESQRTPLVARTGGGVYVVYALGYPSSNRIALWRVGSATSTTIARVGGDDVSASVAADSNGRLWAFWTQEVDGAPRVFAVRSNRSATRWGAVVSAGAPRGAIAIYSVDGSATGNALDVFAVSSIGRDHGASSFFAHVHPGLTLRASPKTLAKGLGTSVTFTVTDAGAPVAHATIRIDGETLHTGANGRVNVRLKSARALTARVSAVNYTANSLTLHVRH